MSAVFLAKVEAKEKEEKLRSKNDEQVSDANFKLHAHHSLVVITKRGNGIGNSYSLY